MITDKQFEGMKHFAETDKGMKDLLEQCIVYYILQGSPVNLIAEAEREKADVCLREFKIMNTRYGL